MGTVASRSSESILMNLVTRNHLASDADAPAIAAYLFDASIKLAQQGGVYIPAQATPKYLIELWAKQSLLVVGLWHDDQLVGVNSGVLSPMFLDTEEIAFLNTGLWVEPEYRKSEGMRQLREGMIDWARRRGAVTATVMIALDSPIKDSLEKFGYSFNQYVGTKRL